MGKGAVVLEIDSCNITLLTEEGAFLRIPAKRIPAARYIGQQVDLAELKPPHYGRWVSVAAACLIFLLVIPLFRPTPAQAWVTLDGSSSLEVLLDKRFRVLEVRALNSAGQLFLEDFPQCEEFSALVDKYLDWSANSGDDKVLITSTAPASKVNELVSQAAPPVDIVLIEVHPKAREEADKLGLSTGRALFVAGADGQGIDISPAEIKEGNPFATLTDAGANIDQVISSSSNPDTQVEKIRDLPKPDPDPSEDSAGGHQPSDPEPVEPPGPGDDSHADTTPPGHAGKEIPPGLADKDIPPGLASRGALPGWARKGPSGQAGKRIPPGLAGKDTPPGQAGKETPPGQAGKDTPPGQVGKGTPPGQAGKNTPPGQAGKELPPGQAGKNTPPGQAGKNTPPGQAGKDNPCQVASVTPLPQASKDLPPGQAKKQKEKIQPPYGLAEKFRPQSAEAAPDWKEEKTGPPFKANGSQNNGNKGNGANKGNGKGNGVSSNNGVGNANGNKGNQGKGNKKP